MIGCVLGGRYRIDARIGEGGMGVVYRAYQSDLERFVAIKLPHKARAFDRTHLQRFAREAQVLSRLFIRTLQPCRRRAAHPTGARFCQWSWWTACHSVSCLPPPDLWHRMRCLSLLIDVAGALAHAHNRGVVQRDLKPANVMVVQVEAGESARGSRPGSGTG